MRPSSINLGEVLAALAVVSFGLFILWEAIEYDFGTPSRMGPGFFPVGIGSILVIIGLVLTIEALRSSKTTVAISLRAMFAIAAGLVAFALLVPTLGLVPGTVGLVVLSLLAERGRSWKLVVGLCAVLSALGFFVFDLGFGIPLDPFWW